MVNYLEPSDEDRATKSNSCWMRDAPNFAPAVPGKSWKGLQRLHRRDAPPTHSRAFRPRSRALHVASDVRAPRHVALFGVCAPVFPRPVEHEKVSIPLGLSHMLTATRRALARTVPSSAQADVAACVVESATLHGTLPAPLSHIQVRARSSATRRRVPRSRSNASRPPRRVHHDTRPPPPRRDPDPHDPDLPSSAAAEISVWSRPLLPPAQPRPRRLPPRAEPPRRRGQVSPAQEDRLAHARVPRVPRIRRRRRRHVRPRRGRLPHRRRAVRDTLRLGPLRGRRR